MLCATKMKEKKHKHSKTEKREKKSKHKHSKKSHKSKETRVDKHDSSTKRETQEIPILHSDDYFLRSEEFRVWLHLDKNRSFEELDSNQSHSLFDEFCSQWNHRRLPTMYYTGT
jgi:hypothetical protein